MATYNIGEYAHLTAAVSIIATGLLGDPTTTTFKIHAPDGSTSTVTPTRDSLGVYHYDFLCAMSGEHLWSVSGTGAVVAANPNGAFYVRPNPF